MHDEYTCLLCAEIENLIGEHVHHDQGIATVEHLAYDRVGPIAGKIVVTIPPSCILDRDALLLRIRSLRPAKEEIFVGPTQTTKLSLVSASYSQQNSIEIAFKYEISTYRPEMTGGTNVVKISVQTR